MEKHTPAQTRIDRERAQASQRFPTIWAKMLRRWRRKSSQHRAWLMYSANYLFSTGNVRWAMDPVRLCHRLPGATGIDAARDLGDLSFVLLTHQHGDHLDLELIHSLRNLPIVWVIPEPVLPRVQSDACLLENQIIVPRMLQPTELHGLQITAFEGLHWETEETGNMRGVPAVGYLVEMDNRRWLFPGDTRTYEARRLPQFGPVDVLFAHVWLGRGSALLRTAPLLSEFCDFCLDLQPREIVLTHLNEYGREAEDYWERKHARQITGELRKRVSCMHVTTALMGNTLSL